MRKKVTLNMSSLEILVLMAEGNPGAIAAMTALMKNGPHGLFDVLHLDDMGIRGSMIWVCYKDYCKENVALFSEAIKKRDPTMISFINSHSENDSIAVTGGSSFT